MPDGIDDIHGKAVMICRLRRMIYTPLGVILFGRGGACSSRMAKKYTRIRVTLIGVRRFVRRQSHPYVPLPVGLSLPFILILYR